jgi:hypothetical protein
LLYESVDLSFHNAPDLAKSRVPETWSGNPVDAPLSFVTREPTSLDATTERRQEQFLQTIIANPHLGKHVCELRWTVSKMVPWTNVFEDDRDHAKASGDDDDARNNDTYTPYIVLHTNDGGHRDVIDDPGLS